MKRGSVVVGFCDGGEWSACFGLSYRDMCLYDIVNSQRIVREGGKELRAVCGTGGIPGGRNQIVRDFLDNTDGEWLFFVDSDMGFAPDSVDRLVASADQYKRPVMGGLAFQLKRDRRVTTPFYAERFTIAPTLYQYVELSDEVGFLPIHDYPRDEVVQVAGTGAAFMLIHRRVLEKIRERSGDQWFEPIAHPTGLNGAPRTFSEDLSFCVRCQAVDVPIHVDTSVKTTHDKGALFLDEEMYDRQRMREAVGANGNG